MAHQIENFDQRADALIAERQFAAARALLEAAIRAMPGDWKPSRDEGEFREIAFWNEDELRAAPSATKPIFWAADSYSRAWYQLGVVAIEQERLEEALFCIERGLEGHRITTTRRSLLWARAA